jgi:DNA-binding NarL/FixJ family response regulator
MRETYQMVIRQEPTLELCGMAPNGAQALAEIPALLPDLSLVDISLPDMDGFELIRQLRQQGASLPFLIVSGHSAAHFADRLEEIGVLGFVDKGEAHIALVPTILSILDKIGGYPTEAVHAQRNLPPEQVQVSHPQGIDE